MKDVYVCECSTLPSVWVDRDSLGRAYGSQAWASSWPEKVLEGGQGESEAFWVP